MRRSEFERAVSDEFGLRSSAMTSDLVLSSCRQLTAVEALKAGISPREVWLALCEEADVPRERRYGAGRQEPRKRT